MSEKKPKTRRSSSRAKNSVQTRSGKTLRINQTLGDRRRARKDEKAKAKAVYLATLPKERWKRVLYRLHPKRVFKYWFSKRGALMMLKITGIGIVTIFILLIAVFAYFRKDLPKLDDINSAKFGGSITYYDRTGKVVLFEDYDSVKRVPVQADQMSKYVRWATVATEDKDFYHHGAFDVTGIIRAGLNDVFGSGGRQGGSTITQQLVKLDQGWTADQTYARKIKELILAVDVEREYSKDDILTGYLNLAPYGPIENGVQTAAQDYFHKDAKDLTLAESAFLAAIPKSPSYYSPYGPSYDKDALLARQHYVLDRMTETKGKDGNFYITKQEAEAAKKVDILAEVHPRPSTKYQGIKAPYFVLAAKEQLEDQLGTSAVKQGGWKVITSVDMDLQKLAEDQVSSGMSQIQRQGGDTAAFVAEDNTTGQIVALVGGADFDNPDHGKINYATDVNISPGSSFKPYDYATFIDNNSAGAGSVLYDQDGALPGYPCTNHSSQANGGNCLKDYDFLQPGPITLRYALGGSRNVPAVKAMLSAKPNDTSQGRVDSINKTIDTAEAMMGNPDGYRCYNQGIDIFTAKKSDETQCYGSSAIGDGAYLHLDDHVNGIATLARLGKVLPKTYILKVTDASGKTVKEWTQPEGKQVLKAETAYIMNDMASDPRASYLGGSCSATSCYGNKFHRYNGWNFAIKTGTTNYSFDGLMESWSTKYTATVWVGYHTRNQKLTGFMETMTDPIVKGWMQGAHKNLKPVNWTKPSGIQTLPAFVITHKVSRNGEIVPSPSTDIFPSWYSPKSASATTATIDKVSGKLATECTPPLARETSRNGNGSAFSVDVFVGGNAQQTKQNDDVHSCDDDKPSVYLITATTCTAGTACQFTVTPSQGTHLLVDPKYTSLGGGVVKLIVNGKTVQSLPIIGNNQAVSFSYTPKDPGTIQVSAEVVDSVLYAVDSSSKTVSVAQGTSPGDTGNPPDDDNQ